MSALRSLSNLLYRRPNLYLALLLVPPLTWFGAIYLGSLLNLLWQGFYTFDDFTMAVTPDLTLGNFAALFNPSNFDIILRTLGSRKLSEREGRLLKLLSGLMMFGLGVLLVWAPEKLDQPLFALLVPLAAVALTWLTARFSRN